MFFKPKYITILDIGSCSVRAYAGECGSDGMFKIKTSTEIEYEGFYKGEWLSEESLTSSVKSAIAQLESTVGKSKAIYIGVPGEFIYCETKNLLLTFQGFHKIVDKDIDDIYEQGKRFSNDNDYEYISSSAVYFTLDGKKRLIDPRGAVANSLELIASYILCKRSFTTLFNKMLESCQVDINYISSDWAQAFSLIEPEKRDNGVLLCDIGYLTTSIMLVRGDGIVEHKAFSNGGGFINADLAEVLQIPFKAAVEIKKMIDINVDIDEDEVYEIEDAEGGNPKSKLALEVTLARIEDICDDIRKAVAGFSQVCPPYIKIYLTGGGITDIRGATRVFAEKLERSVEVIAPSHPGFNRPRFASSVGIMEVVARKEQSKVTIIKRLFNK